MKLKCRVFYVFVVVLLSVIGCSDEDDPRVIYEDCDLPLDKELVDNRPLIERVKLVELSMGFEEVRYILGIPRGIKSIPFEWWYDLGEEVEDVKKRYIIIRFGNDMVIDKLYGTGSTKPWTEYGEELRRDLF